MGIRSFAYKGIPINRDHGVLGEQVYIGNGQNCGTFWFASVGEVKKFIDAYRIHPDKHGLGLIPEDLCKHCQCHYSAFTEEYRKYQPFACRGYKKRLVRKALSK